MPNQFEKELPQIPLGSVIKKLRKDLGLSQVDFAAEIGVTPASIYRYEAGSSAPSRQTIANLQRFAAQRHHREAEHTFHRALYGEVKWRVSANPAFSVIEASASHLNTEDLPLVLALVLFLSTCNTSDEPIYKAIKALLAPQLKAAEAALVSVLSEKEGTSEKKSAV